MNMRLMLAKICGLAALASTGVAVRAQETFEDLPVIGKPVPGGVNFQPAATSLAEDIRWLDGFILLIITVITLFVTALLVVAVVRRMDR